MRTSALFVAKTNIEFFKIYSVSTFDMDRGDERGEGLGRAYIFLDKRRSIFHDFCVNVLYGWTLSKKKC